MTSIPETSPYRVERAQIHLRDVRLSADLILDEVDLDGNSIEITLAQETPKARAGETKFHVMMTEPRLNALLAAKTPADATVRNLRLALLSGKIRVTGEVVKSVLHLPFTTEGMLLVENAVRLRLDFTSAKLGGAVGIPQVVLEMVEQHLNNNPQLPLDLSRLPVPVRLDEIRCEPGRLHVSGRARLQWPLAPRQAALAPFAPRAFSPAALTADEESSARGAETLSQPAP